MDFDHGGTNSSDQPAQSAAEIARNKVLAAYSSTIESFKNLPPETQDAIYSQAQSSPISQPAQSSQSSQSSQLAAQTSWINTPTPEYQRTAIYSQPTPPAPQPVAHTTNKIPRLKRRPNFFNRNESKKQLSSSPISQSENLQPTNFASFHTETTQQFSPQTTAQPRTQPYSQPTIIQNQTYSTQTNQAAMLKDAPIDQTAINDEWQKYHSAWQDYYKKYYSEYYAKAAQNYLATEKMKDERIATGRTARKRRLRRFAPAIIIGIIIATGLFLQYNRLIFAPIMAYISPDAGSVTTSLEAVDPVINQTVSPEPRLIIPKLNIDVPVEFNISTSSVDEAMNHGVAQFSIPGANALPGQIGNLVITGHSAGDIYSSNPYKFIFSGLERLNPGDLIYVNYDSKRYTYQMTGNQVVEPSDVSALIYDTDKPILTLITCTPLGTSRYRLLVTAEQISPAYDEANLPNPDETPSTTEDSTEPEMPANEPSFFESLWHAIFG